MLDSAHVDAREEAGDLRRLEVLSPITASRDRVQKMKLYADAGIAHDWLIDVDARTLEALELHGQRWVLAGSCCDDANARIAPFADIELPIGRLFLPRTQQEAEALEE